VAADARSAALAALGKRRRNGARLDEALAAASSNLSQRDAALAMKLCWGVTQNHALIDLALNGLVKNPHPKVTDILRLSAYQLWFLDRVPKHAVIDEAVRLCKKAAPHAAGMVNAVLRRLPDRPPETDDLAVKYSMTSWFHARMGALLPPEELEPFYAACNAIPPIYMQYGSIVADPGARRAVDILGPQPGGRVWDVCAAPGGKTLMAAFAMQNKGKILATDKNADKLPLIRESLTRCKMTNTEVKQADASVYTPDGQFDAVLCDVPCSGFGVLRKKPDIRYRTQVGHFPALQSAILRNASKAVRDGGTLLYCTCTLLPEENEDVIKAFLTESFTVEHTETLWPHKGDTDGFFICKMRKQRF
jgi:16S rRNA (cytosine967-C5)-methyltransferase